jgi:hypothetical protein
MAHLRESVAAFLSLTLFEVPVWSVPSSTLGTVTSARGAHVGIARVSAGATVFDGDTLSTEHSGNIQIRIGAARLMLRASSSATLGDLDGTPSATLWGGTAIFSTALARAFVLRAATAEIRPQDDGPTIAQVSIVNSKQLIVCSTRGALMIIAGGETQVIPEAMAYRVILDPGMMPEPANPRGARTKDFGWPPQKPSKNHFYLVAVFVASVPTSLALDEVFESPDKP